MKKRELIISAFAGLLLLLLGYLWLSPEGLQEAPAVTLTDLRGKPVAIKDLKGKPVLVVFWATTCPGCIEEMPHLVELYHELHPRGLEIIGIAMAYDPPPQVREMVEQRQLPYTIAMDRDGSAALAFNDVKLTPTSFLINPRGRIVKQQLGNLDFDRLRARILPMLKG